MKVARPTRSRRQFLQAMLATGAALALPGCRPGSSAHQTTVSTAAPATSGWPGGLDPAPFIVHSRSPMALEVRRSQIGRSVITPISRFFVRNNLPMPSDTILAHPDEWALEVAGVAQPGSITLAELKGLGIDTEGAVLQCSGNGRAFFEHDPSGSPWRTGAAGCAVWTGVRVRTVVEHFGGVTSGKPYLTSTGGEALPDGLDRDDLVVERSIPIDKALDDALLAWEMNGEPLPLTHGGPLRLIVPGYYGVNSIKYVRRIAATSTESSAKIQQSGYRMRPLGEAGAPTQPSMWRMPVKSWINGPGADDTPTLAGRVTFYGVALSGERGVQGVDVSLDEGDSWQSAELVGPDLGPNAWRTFAYTTDLEPGTYTIASRATDARGDVQPRASQPNERGYGHNGWLDAALRVDLVAELPERATAESPSAAESAPPPAEPTAARPKASLSADAQAGRDIFQSAQPPCGVCHTLTDAGTQGAVGPNLNDLKPDAATVESAVTGGVGAMPAYDHTLTPEQIEQLSKYVAEASK